MIVISMGKIIFPMMALLVLALVPEAQSWSKEGHMLTCKIAQELLEEDAAEAVKNLLPRYVEGDLSKLCTWPDQIRLWYKYRWSSPLHFIDTPDGDCSFNYARDCHDQHGNEDMCVAGAVRNFTEQLMHYREGSSDRRYNLTESLLFLSHFMGDIHQVWDRDIILQAMSKYYEKDLDVFLKDLQKNLTTGMWSNEIPSWVDCEDLSSCTDEYAAESIGLACDWGYKNVTNGETLADEYFDSRLPVVMKRIAQGGVRLAMILNRVFGGEEEEEIPWPT
ncbi:Endonuclease 1 [Dendrobium catenatum]|uniref:Aspergillus nuclease S1 n=1 Tax=Dendrobium catenatum TaxID=906689 RepID=A0A2I0XDD5_9ASPA|nr:Endonuclease 1 [Dendrobium catenatum]